MINKLLFSRDLKSVYHNFNAKKFNLCKGHLRKKKNRLRDTGNLYGEKKDQYKKQAA